MVQQHFLEEFSVTGQFTGSLRAMRELKQKADM